ncbi:hypothetical protein AC62_5623 [Escherichia coli 6-175-07_S3_C3]|nr:hypothetical protein AKN41_p0009 [Escherichia coli]KEJ82079.1 hypothetical protein AC37_5664 [Escherichia coli 6-175-07_S3_C2]KEL87907.1 hypothetical protein AC62_5623 [Escherichia coli 6-175-07_S3_C3]KEM41111.1 hypothetical protein AC38_5129 [Escherichia coli 6-319-05_S3_C2]
MLSEILVFKLFRAETAARIVATPAIVITLDIINTVVRIISRLAKRSPWIQSTFNE